MWKKRFIDHCSSSTGQWKDMFRMCEESEGPILRAYLEQLHIGSGYSAWVLAEDLENFLVKYISDDLYERREAWCGGEEGNGFELYRNLFREFEGGSTIVRMGGRKLLNNFGRPQKGEDIQKHFEDWQCLLGKYGADLMANPDECYYRALEVIPAEFEEEIVMKPEIRTMQDIFHYVSRKTTHQRHMAQQRALIQSRLKRSPMSELSPKPKEMNIDDIVARTLAAVQNAKANPRDKGKREKSPGPQPGKFWFKPDCWWCGADGHQKRDCNLYKKMLADNGGTRPKGLKGAFEKARDAWNKDHPRDRDNRNRSKSPRSMKPLISDDDYSDSDDSESDLAPIGCLPCTNVFGLRCLPYDDADDHIEEENDEPAHVTWKRENDAIDKRLAAERPIICCGYEPDTQNLDGNLDDNSHSNSLDRELVVDDIDEIIQLFALPSDAPTTQFAVPDSEDLEDGEMYAMMDSGAGCHAAWAKKAFARHKRRKGKQVRRCVLADGTPMESEDVVDVKVDIEGETHVIEFDDLPVECPIISVRKIVHKGNKVVFKKKGGYILNIKTGKKLHCVESTACISSR